MLVDTPQVTSPLVPLTTHFSSAVLPEPFSPLARLNNVREVNRDRECHSRAMLLSY